MRHRNRRIVLLWIMAGSLLAACTSKPATSGKIEPAKVEAVEGGLNRVVLTEKAAERLDIQTAPVREEQVVRKRKVGGEVVAWPEGEAGDLGGVLVRVPLNESDLNKVDRGQAALVVALSGEEGAAGLTAHPVEGPAVGGSDEGTEALYYVVESAEPGLVAGQIVLVELSLAGSGGQQKVIPYGAVIYDLHGETWVYTNPERLVFVRHPIVVEYIEGDQAVLMEGPAVGVEVATVGVAELYGTEFGVGK